VASGTSGSVSRTLTSITDLLAGWLPRQRWFPGRGTAVRELSVLSDVTLRAGDPALRHMIVEAALPHATARFQVLVGSRAVLPPSLSDAVIGQLDGATYYDALHDGELAGVLLGGIAEQRTAGSLRFVKEPAADVGTWPDSRRLTAEQSNTSLVFGEQAIMKVLRRLFPGANPDLEVADALARLGSPRVAAPFGWIETEIDGHPVLLGVLSEYLAAATDGWTMACAAASGLYAGRQDAGRLYAGRQDADRQDADRQAPASAEPDTGRMPQPVPFADQARVLGAATAELHADMATAFGTRPMTKSELSGLADDLSAKLADAIDVVPELRRHQGRLQSVFEAVRLLEGPILMQRIHGDYHLGQVMLGNHGWVALDFEGEPGVPLAKRRALAPAMRDVAGMLRSFDYAARHQLAGRSDTAGLLNLATAWARKCQHEFCAGYAEAGGASPRDQAELLHALTLDKAVYEVIYEHRHRPSWVSIPLDFLATA
jgi:maltokinase